MLMRSDGGDLVPTPHLGTRFLDVFVFPSPTCPQVGPCTWPVSAALPASEQDDGLEDYCRETQGEAPTCLWVIKNQ